MGLGSILGGIAGAFTGIPGGSAIGAGLGGAFDSATSNKAKAGGPGTAADPGSYLNIKIPGFNYPGNYPTQNLVDMPAYPTMPGYQGGPQLPAQLMPATAGETGTGQSLASSKAALQASLNPNSPEFQRIAQQQSQAGRQAYTQGVRDLLTQNRRQMAMGRTSALNPETGTSDVLMGILNNNRNSDMQGQDAARTILGNASSAYGTLGNQYNTLASQENTRRNTFLDQLNTNIGQQRADVQNTNATQRGDILGNYNAQMQNIINALNLYRGNQGTLQPAQAAANAANIGMQGAQSSAITDSIRKLFSSGGVGSSGGGTDLGSSMPWLGASGTDLGSAMPWLS